MSRLSNNKTWDSYANSPTRVREEPEFFDGLRGADALNVLR